MDLSQKLLLLKKRRPIFKIPYKRDVGIDALFYLFNEVRVCHIFEHNRIHKSHI